jgi:DNA-binding winged helix-turn-helix (wHTH) protein
MAKRARQFFEFGQFRLDVERTRLIREGEIVSLPPKAISLLLILLQHVGRAVEKEELIETLWPDTVVEDSNLTQTVHLLRKAIGKYQDSDIFIETLPRFGYRLIADVREFLSEGEELAGRRTFDPVEPIQPLTVTSAPDTPEPSKTIHPISSTIIPESVPVTLMTEKAQLPVPMSERSPKDRMFSGLRKLFGLDAAFGTR